VEITDDEQDVFFPLIELPALFAPSLDPSVEACAKKRARADRHLLVLPAKPLLLQIGLIG
jgi:hypothetical protein